MIRLTRELLTPFLDRCLGRCSDYAIQEGDGRYRRAGHALTEQMVLQHLQAVQTIGTYVINEQGLCSFAVYDSDTPSGLADLAAVQGTLLGVGIPSYLEQSRRGAHLWVFLSEPLSPAHVRSVLLPFCPSGGEFYPKQDALTPERPYGSLIRLPLGIHRRSGLRYPFIEVVNGSMYPLASSVADMLSVFSTFERAHLPISLKRCIPSSPQPAPNTHTYPSNNLLSSSPVHQVSIRQWCLAYDPVSVIGRYVSLDTSGSGRCPLGSHHRDGVDAHPSFSVYRPASPDLCCWYCHTWGRGGSLFDFFRLYYGLEARELWHRILSGAQF